MARSACLALLLFGSAIAGSASSAQASELKPLREILAEGGNASYFALRCSAFFFVLAERAGKKRLGTVAYNKYHAIAANLAGIAIAMTQNETGMSLSESQDSVQKSLIFVGNAYRARMDQNYNMSGSAFSGDALIEDDMNVCTTLSSRS